MNALNRANGMSSPMRVNPGMQMFKSPMNDVSAYATSTLSNPDFQRVIDRENRLERYSSASQRQEFFPERRRIPSFDDTRHQHIYDVDTPRHARFSHRYYHSHPRGGQPDEGYDDDEGEARSAQELSEEDEERYREGDEDGDEMPGRAHYRRHRIRKEAHQKKSTINRTNLKSKEKSS